MKSSLLDRSILATPEQALEFVTNILESSTEYSLIATDLDGTILLWNEGARRLYQYEPEEVIGRLNATQLNSPDETRDTQELFVSTLRDGKWEGTLRRRRKTGEEFVARAALTPRLDAARQPIGFLIISSDVSEETRVTAQLETANRELREQIAQRQNAENALLHAHKELELRARGLEQSALQMKLLTEMSELLQSCVSSEEARGVAQQALQKFFPWESGTIYLNSEFGGMVESFASWNSAIRTSKETFEPQECWALRRGRPHIIGDDESATRCIHVLNKDQGGSICVPMIGQGQSLGVFHVSWEATGPAQDPGRAEDRVRLALALADTLALAVSNVRLREALKEQTIRDPLTRLYNRRYLEDSLGREVSRAKRAGTSIGIIMLDVDNFKQFNDSFGHPIGDRLLRALGDYLKARVRPGDIPSRYGGEEFTLILPEASMEIVRERAESLREGFSQIPLHLGTAVAKIPQALSLSCGVAIFPEHGTTAEEILRAADEALYQAKRAGKNRVVIAAGSANAPALAAREQAHLV